MAVQKRVCRCYLAHTPLYLLQSSCMRIHYESTDRCKLLLFTLYRRMPAKACLEWRPRMEKENREVEWRRRNTLSFLSKTYFDPTRDTQPQPMQFRKSLLNLLEPALVISEAGKNQVAFSTSHAANVSGHRFIARSCENWLSWNLFYHSVNLP